MLLNNGDTYEADQADVIQWEKTYPAINVYQELNAMESWLDANPTRRKTPKGIKSEYQREFEKQAIAHGYYYAVVKSVGDCITLLEKYKLNQI